MFDFVADECNEPRYNPDMLRAENISEGPIGPGTRFRAEVTSMGRPLEMIIEITAYDRPRLLASSTHMSAMDIHGTLTFDPYEMVVGCEAAWFLQVFDPINQVNGQASGRTQLEKPEELP